MMLHGYRYKIQVHAALIKIKISYKYWGNILFAYLFESSPATEKSKPRFFLYAPQVLCTEYSAGIFSVRTFFFFF